MSFRKDFDRQLGALRRSVKSLSAAEESLRKTDVPVEIMRVLELLKAYARESVRTQEMLRYELEGRVELIERWLKRVPRKVGRTYGSPSSSVDRAVLVGREGDVAMELFSARGQA